MITRNIQDFYKELKNGRLLAVDYGSKKLGFAISDDNNIMALPQGIEFCKDHLSQINLVLKKITSQNIAGIVVGLPLNMDGSESEQSILCTKFATKIAKESNLPVYLQDERLTSKAANQSLKMLGMKRRERDAQDDRVAASMILESTLESLARLNK